MSMAAFLEQRQPAAVHLQVPLLRLAQVAQLIQEMRESWVPGPI